MKSLFYTGVLLVLAISCKTANTAVDYDRAIDFNTIKTYNYANNSSIQLNQLDSTLFMRTLERNLHAKGLLKSDNPDVLLSIQVYGQAGDKVNTVNLGIGGGSRWFGLGTDVGIPIRKKVTDYYMQIDILNSQNNNLIWTGTATGTTSFGANADSKGTLFRTKIQGLLKNYPPVPKKGKKSNYYN